MDVMCCNINTRVISIWQPVPLTVSSLFYRLVSSSSDILGYDVPGRLLSTASHGPEFMHGGKFSSFWDFHHTVKPV